jgi:glucose/arabinose dehydrogenase
VSGSSRARCTIIDLGLTMQLRRVTATIHLVVAGLVLAQGGCVPDTGSLVPKAGNMPAASGTTVSRPTNVANHEIPGTASAVASDAADRTAQSAASTATSPDGAAPGTTASSASASPDNHGPSSMVPRPARAANASPSVVPSVSPTAKPATAANTPAPQTPAEVIAVTLAKANTIALIDPVTDKVTRTLDLTRPTGAMTLAPDGRSAWVFGPHAGQSFVSWFDALTGARHEDIQFKQNDSPDAVAFSSDGTHAFIAMGADASAPSDPGTIAFASADGREFGRVTVGRQTKGVQIRRHLSSLAVSPGPNGDVLYAAGQASGVVWALDAASGAVVSEIEVGGGPTKILVDPARQRAYVLLDTLNQVVALDTTTLAITNRLNLPSHAIDATIGPDGTLFIAGGDTSAELWVVEPSATDIRSRVPIGGQVVGLTMSSDGKSLYLADAAASALNVVSADTIQVTRAIALPSEPLGVVDARSSASGQQLTAAPSAAAGATAAATPALVATPTPLPEGARQPDHLPADAIAEPFLSGADAPVALAFAPDGRLFYNEVQTGNIRVVQNGALLPDPFYQFLVSDQPGTGLVGLTLDPNFQENHYVYAFFTAPADRKSGGGTSGPNEILRLTDVDNKGTSVTPILRDLPSGDTHTSGALRFGPDGKLYVALGDNDKGTYAQDLTTLAGKILRVNPDGSVPDDNPFVGDPSRQGAIWAYGLHNPYSFAFHPVGHQLLSVDNGRGSSDALNLIVRGANYGWPPPAGAQSKPAGVTDPLASMSPAIGPTGSTFYTGDQMPDWKNDWFYCNAGQAELRRVRLAPGSFDRIVSEEVVKQGCSYDVVTGPDGALYYSDAKGIYRIRRTGAEVVPAVKMGAVPQPAAIETP